MALVAALCIALPSWGAEIESTQYSKLVSRISRVQPPVVDGKYVIFTADGSARFTGIAFGFEDYKTIDRKELYYVEVREREGTDRQAEGTERVGKKTADERAGRGHEADDGEIPGDVRDAVFDRRERKHHLVRSFPERGREDTAHDRDEREDDKVITRREEKVPDRSTRRQEACRR